ncbi:MAG: response regulator transcription factor [Bacillota bacterium]
MEKILLVEDDGALAMGLEFALKKEGYMVDLASSISDARLKLNKNTYDLILMDVMLPDGNGYELCSSIRENSNVAIIFLTACDEEVNVVLGLDIGGDDYITKPFRVKELISRIKAVMRRKSEHSSKEAAHIISSFGICFFPLETRVTKNGKELYLTPAEYKLLSVLLLNPLQTLSREVILERLWDIEGEFVDDNTLSVYIRRLREKLEDNPSEPDYIVTVRGMGYKWNKKHDAPGVQI